jgi:hypothetical protein
MGTRNLLGGKGRPACKADNLNGIRVPIVNKKWEPQRLTTLWASTACHRDNFTLLPYILRSTSHLDRTLSSTLRVHNDSMPLISRELVTGRSSHLRTD